MITHCCRNRTPVGPHRLVLAYSNRGLSGGSGTASHDSGRSGAAYPHLGGSPRCRSNFLLCAGSGDATAASRLALAPSQPFGTAGNVCELTAGCRNLIQSGGPAAAGPESGPQCPGPPPGATPKQVWALPLRPDFNQLVRKRQRGAPRPAFTLQGYSLSGIKAAH